MGFMLHSVTNLLPALSLSPPVDALKTFPSSFFFFFSSFFEAVLCDYRVSSFKDSDIFFKKRLKIKVKKIQNL